jgi:uncharacterized protein YlxW (UPF0749 family)
MLTTGQLIAVDVAALPRICGQCGALFYADACDVTGGMMCQVCRADEPEQSIRQQRLAEQAARIVALEAENERLKDEVSALQYVLNADYRSDQETIRRLTKQVADLSARLSAGWEDRPCVTAGAEPKRAVDPLHRAISVRRSVSVGLVTGRP